MPLVQSQWAWNLRWGWRSSLLPSGGIAWVSHTDTTPSVSPLSRYLPELHRDTPKKNKIDTTNNDSSVVIADQPLYTVWIFNKMVNLNRQEENGWKIIIHYLLVVNRERESLLVQVKVDALVGGHIPLEWKHNIVRLSQVPAQDLWILRTNTHMMCPGIQANWKLKKWLGDF